MRALGTKSMAMTRNLFIVEMLQNLINKLIQRPDYYPIRFYKKVRRKGIYV
jgi:hypothetical protein